VSFRGRLVYANFRGPDKFGDFDTMILDAPGGTARLIAQYASDPVFSPDGTRILYYSWTEGGFYSMGLDGKSQVMVSTSADDAHPAWSPDGKRVAFDNKGDIWFMNADGSGRTKVISGGQEPDWSPDGKQLLLKGCIASTCGLVIADADGKNQRQLTSDATDESPTWDPSGSLILFTSKRSGRGDVWVVRPDGSSPQNLTSVSAGGPVGSRNSGAATWSRDGKSILFRSDRDGSWGIYVMNRDGSGQSRLVSSSVTDEWSHERVDEAK
jgi:TolB protein